MTTRQVAGLLLAAAAFSFLAGGQYRRGDNNLALQAQVYSLQEQIRTQASERRILELQCRARVMQGRLEERIILTGRPNP